MRRLLLLFLITVVPSVAGAQVPYQVTHRTSTYTPITGGTVHQPVAYGAFPAWDEGAAQIALPFTFQWYGIDYTTVYAYTNGFISFDAPVAGTGILAPPSAVPSAANGIHNFIGGPWQDLNAGANAEIRSRVDGVAGSRVLTIQFTDMVRFAGTSAANFQFKLYESNDSAEVIFGTNFGIVDGTTAIENDDGTDGLNLMLMSASCNGNCPCAIRRCASINWSQGLTVLMEVPSQAELSGRISAPPGARPGTNFDVDLEVFNVGQSNAAAFNYRVLLATNNTDLTGAVELQSFRLPSLNAGTMVARQVSLTVPAMTPPGLYWIALEVDSAGEIDEATEANNIIFDGPFGTAANLTGTLAGPNDTGPGEQLNVSLELRSDGADVPGPVRVAFFLSPQPDSTAVGAVSLGSRTVTLPDGFFTQANLTLTTPPGTPPSPPSYYLIAVLDDANTIVELDETDNEVIAGDTLTVRAPDLEVINLDAPDLAFLGLPYAVDTTVRNTGGAIAQDIRVCLVLSNNAVINVVNDLEIATTGLVSLAANTQSNFHFEGVIPVGTSTGSYFLAVVADCDDAVPESSEGNNVRVLANNITVGPPAADLTIHTLDAGTVAAAGETLPVAYSVANNGNAPAPATVRMFLSTNPAVSAASALIYEAPTSPTINPTENRPFSAWASLPANLASGTYYVGVIVDPDNTEDEIDETNNIRVAGPIAVEGSGLAIITPSVPAAVIDVAYEVRFDAIGGSEAPVWSLNWDAIPPAGMSFNPATAMLSGTPDASAEGAHGFEVTVTSGALTQTERFELLVTYPTVDLVIVSSRLPPAVAGETYRAQLVAAGGFPPYIWTLNGLTVPGLSMSEEGLISGEPQVVAVGSFDVTVCDQRASCINGTLVIDIVDPTANISIVTADLPVAVVNREYATEFQAAGGREPYSWRIEGDLAGITFNAAAARLTGTPTVAGNYPVVVEAVDADGLVDRNAYILEVLEEGVLRITTGDEDAELPKGIINQDYVDADGQSVSLAALPDDGSLRWSVANGRLPPGLTLNLETGAVTGTPSELGVFAFTALVRNDAGDLHRRTLAILVDETGGQGPIDEGCGCNTAEPRASVVWLFVMLVALLRRRRC